ncbi:MAG: hypothetical protein HC804_04605, partial [Anaerolineae bacterium]|nr:hypothetical protein [Anaerolineae bacterium]
MSESESVNDLNPTPPYQALLKAGTAVSANLNTPTLLTELARQLVETFQITSVYISDWNPDSGLTTILAEFRSSEANAKELQSDVGSAYDLYNEVKRGNTFLQTSYPLLLHVDDPVRLDAMAAVGARTGQLQPLDPKQALGVQMLAYQVDGRHEQAAGPEAFMEARRVLTKGLAITAVAAAILAIVWTTNPQWFTRGNVSTGFSVLLLGVTL